MIEPRLIGRGHSRMSKMAKQWLPPILRRWGNRILGASIVYRGPFNDWASAFSSTEGYGQHAILERVSLATRQVLDGFAVYEQDGIALHHAPPPSHALNGLLLAAALDGGRLSVLDLGGGLASHYLRWRSVLSTLPDVHWAVVEQASYVMEGRRLFSTDPAVFFHDDIATVSISPNVVLASSVLQYLPEPYQTLRRLMDFAPRMIVLDRLPCGTSEVVMSQSVPPNLGKASYPLWILSRERVHAQLSRDYRLLLEFEAADQPLQAARICAEYRGSIWQRRI